MKHWKQFDSGTGINLQGSFCKDSRIVSITINEDTDTPVNVSEMCDEWFSNNYTYDEAIEMLS